MEFLENTLWNGFQQKNFLLHGHNVILVVPETPALGNPWIWRTEFFGAFAYADLEMVRRGWHIAYLQVSDQYGCPKAISMMKVFHDVITHECSLSPKADLFGFSRGGLYAVNYAAQYPEDVRSIYLDAPVLDIRSWPAGWGTGIGAEKEWEECKRCYSITDESAKMFCENPLDHLEPLLRHKIPVLLVAGTADTVVPFAENGKKMEQFYQNHGKELPVILKEGAGHHPHSLNPPDLIVSFLMSVESQA